MSELSEQQLLLLSNYAYFNCSTNKGTIQENIDRLKNENGSFNIKLVEEQGATGDIISDDDAVDILNRLQNDEILSKLHTERTINRGGIRATLYTNDSNGEATLVFRGTGGTYMAWQDNVLGEYETDTKIQRLAGDFVKYECGAYDDITVTGHSKGGNLSQYVTVVCGDQIDRCVSFDGQGFGSSFLEKYDSEIQTAKGKITSINGYNDFVNILLTPIAGTILYVNNQEGLGLDMHSCYTMLSNGFFNEEGNFNRDFGVKPQLYMMSSAKKAGDAIVSFMEMLPGNGNEKATNVLGTITAAVFSADKGKEYEDEKISSAIREFRNYTRESIGFDTVCEDSVCYDCDYLYINLDAVKRVYSDFEDVTYKMAMIPEKVEDVLQGLDYNILGRSFTERALKNMIKRTEEQYEKVKSIRDLLGTIIDCYEKADFV